MTSSPTQYFCWAYDHFGNRWTQEVLTGAGFTNLAGAACAPSSSASLVSNQWAYHTVDGANSTADNGLNRLTGAPNGILQYDGAGNVTQDAQNKYLYDAEGRLCAVMNSTTAGTVYFYDAEGRRVARGQLSGNWPSACPAPTDPSVTLTAQFVRGKDGDQDTELDGQGNWVHTNVFSGGGLTASYWLPPTMCMGGIQGGMGGGLGGGSCVVWSSALAFQYSDWLGTRRLETNSQGQMDNAWTSDPFGDYLTPVAFADATEHHFTGKERDTESGNDYFEARYYASSMGRMLSPDPSGMSSVDPSKPQSWNMYSYAFNNPLVLVDPTGLDPCPPVLASPPNGDAGGGGMADGGCDDNPIPPPPQELPNIDPCEAQGDDCYQAQLAEDNKKWASFDAWLKSYVSCPLMAPGGNYKLLDSNAVALFSPSMAVDLTAAFKDLNSQNITPTINSGFRTPDDQGRMQNGGSGPNPAARVSQHEVGMAVDINGTTSSNFPKVRAAMGAQGLTWGGTFSHPDPPHFQLPHAGTSPSAVQVANCQASAGAQ